MTAEIVGHVYVNNNTAMANTISIFDRHADGSLTPSMGGSVADGGAGAGKIIGSQGALQLTADGKYLVAVDPGSNQISVLSVADDGSLSPIDGGTVDSGGLVPVSLTVYDDLVYVANLGDGMSGSNYTGFNLDENGLLTPIANSTVELAPTAAPGDILFNADGTQLIGVEVGPDEGPSQIDSFLVAEDGALTAAMSSPITPEAIGPFGSEFSPTDHDKLYVTNAHAGPTMGSVSAYTVASDGSFTSIGASPFANHQTGTCWIEITQDGKYVFAIDTGTPAISRYEVQADGSLVLLGDTAFKESDGLRPFDARLTPDGAFLYVVDAGTAKVSAFMVDGGNLIEIASSPVDLPTGATPFGIVVN
jgi:6-phosphogluconolactonase (cycloisomerase 2 family)